MMNSFEPNSTLVPAHLEATSSNHSDFEFHKFYVVSIQKFWILFIASFGLYALYWFYKHWYEIKSFQKSDIWPIPRAIFQVFFTHSLFKEITSTLKNKQISFKWVLPPSLLATIYVVVSIVSNAADRFSRRNDNFSAVDVVSLVLLPVLGWCLAQAQKAANLAVGDAQGASNATMTMTNYVWLVFFGLMWLVIFWSLYVVFVSS